MRAARELKPTLGFHLVFGFLGLIGLIALGFHMYYSFQRTLTQLETVMFSAIVFVLDLVAGIYIGVLFAGDSAKQESRPFVRSAFRGNFELSEGIKRAQESIRAAVGRMASRRNVDAATASLLWSEIMNLIQAELTELSRQSQSSLEDWREFRPEEIERFEETQQKKQKEEAAVADSIKELYGLIENMSSEASEGTEETLAELKEIQSKLLSELAGLKERPTMGAMTKTSTASKARELMVEGAYKEAIDLYTRLITAEPLNHTLYISRAKAKYRSGDSRGALADLGTAAQLSPADVSIERVKKQIETGQSLESPRNVIEQPFMSKIKEGTNELINGDLERARELYMEGRKLGATEVQTRVSLVMVDLIKGTANDARKTLHEIDLTFAGDYMTVQVEALRALCDICENRAAGYVALSYALSRCPSFSLSQSPLMFLERAYLQRSLMTAPVAEVFSMLRSIDQSLSPD